ISMFMGRAKCVGKVVINKGLIKGMAFISKIFRRKYAQRYRENMQIIVHRVFGQVQEQGLQQIQQDKREDHKSHAHTCRQICMLPD
ncbi:PIPO, partial [Euphorbia ringspot virus]